MEFLIGLIVGGVIVGLVALFQFTWWASQVFKGF